MINPICVVLYGEILQVKVLLLLALAHRIKELVAPKEQIRILTHLQSNWLLTI